MGWQQYSNTYYPGQNIGSLVGREIYIGYVFWKGNWWASFDNQWIGYFPRIGMEQRLYQERADPMVRRGIFGKRGAAQDPNG